MVSTGAVALSHGQVYDTMHTTDTHYHEIVRLPSARENILRGIIENNQ